MTTIRDTHGRRVTVRTTTGRIVWGGGGPTPEPEPDPDLTVRRHITADVWRTGRQTQNRVPDEAVTYMTAHRVRAHGQDIELTYGGNLPPGVTMDVSAAVEVEGGTRMQGLFGGAAVTTATGTQQVTTDPISVRVRPGDVLRVYTHYGRRSDGLNHPAAPVAWYSNEILTGDQTMTGESRTEGSYDGSAGYRPPMPHAITALTSEDQISVVLLGDSITESGSPGAETLPVGRQTSSRTWAHRALDHAVPVCNHGVWASQYAQSRDDGTWTTVPDLTAFTHAIIAWGYNDLNGAWANSSRDVEWVQRRAIISWTWIRAEVPLLWQATISPNTTSTDGWTTVGGQTPIESLPYRQAYNDWLRDGAPLSGAEPVAVGGVGLRAGDDGHPLVGIIDQAAEISTTPNSGIFRTDHGPLTLDGGHPNMVGHELMSTAAQDWLATL